MKYKKNYLLVFSMLIAMLFISANLNINYSQEKSVNEQYVLRFEHLANNLTDPAEVAKWYKENLGFNIERTTGAPTFTHFISAPAKNGMFEFFHNADFPLFNPSQYKHEIFPCSIQCSGY